METNWIIIGLVVILGLALVIFLMLKNQKDEGDVIEYFNNESSSFQEEDDDELNDEK